MKERKITPVTLNADKALESIDIPKFAVNQRSSAKKSNMDESPSFKQLPVAKEEIRAR